MTLLAKITLAAALLLSIAIPFGAFAAGEKTKGRYKTALGINALLFVGTLVTAGTLMFTGNAVAAETASTASNAAGWGYLAAALSTVMSCIGGGIAVGNAAPAAIGATSEDPKAFGKAIIFVVLGEGIAIYGMLVSILLIFAR